MPTLSRLYIRSALIWLALGTTLGGIILWNKTSPIPGAWQLLTAHITLVTWGWILQFSFGVAYWMFPHMGKEAPRGDERVLWAAFWCLNVGLLLRAVGEPLGALRPGLVPPIVLQASAVLQVAAAWLFAAETWPRVKALAH